MAVTRGEIWSAAGGGDYTGKPRPVVILQDDRFEHVPSITVCPFTSDPTYAPSARLVVEPTELNGLVAQSRLMVDKISTLPRTKLGARIGRLDDPDVARLNEAVLLFLGLAVPTA
ncbi:MAG TPA: type II toxin-antitoxin system PemK/MazF family toxin [Chloroflexota bacterium]